MLSSTSQSETILAKDSCKAGRALMSPRDGILSTLLPLLTRISPFTAQALFLPQWVLLAKVR
jgi:hypothetical protein